MNMDGSGRRGRAAENTGFVCGNCGGKVKPLANGSYRNHCPFCLYSLHVDEEPGDRASGCGALMAPRGVDYNPAKGYVIIHRCLGCGAIRRNKAATGHRQPDQLDRLLALMNNGLKEG